VRRTPDSGLAHKNLAAVLLRIPNRKQEALTELEAAYRLTPDEEIRRALEEMRK